MCDLSAHQPDTAESENGKVCRRADCDCYCCDYFQARENGREYDVMYTPLLSFRHKCLILCSKNVVRKQTEKVIDTYAEYSQELPSFLSPLVTCCALWQCVLEACTPGNNVCHSLHKDIHCSHQCVSLYVNVG